MTVIEFMFTRFIKLTSSIIVCNCIYFQRSKVFAGSKFAQTSWLWKKNLLTFFTITVSLFSQVRYINAGFNLHLLYNFGIYWREVLHADTSSIWMLWILILKLRHGYSFIFLRQLRCVQGMQGLCITPATTTFWIN